jgi:hypothetical protein
MANALMPYIAKTLSSQTLKYLKRQLWQLRTSEPVLEVFIRIDDPHSYLLIQTFGLSYLLYDLIQAIDF